MGLLVIYWPSFTAPFFQDDFELLAQRGEWFTAVPVYHYHPISNQIFYSLANNIFGSTPLGFHVALFGITVTSLLVIYFLANDLLRDRTIALLTVFFFGFNVSLFPNFYWIAISYFVFGGFFFFCTVWLFLKNSRISNFFSIIAFLAAFLSNELTIIIPAVLTLISWYRKRFSPKLIAFWVIGSLLLLFKRFVVGFSPEPVYQTHFDFAAISTFRWYLLRALNLPEGIRNGADFSVVFLTTVFIVILALTAIFAKKKNPRLLLFGLGWFLLGALPFYFLPQHMSAYYLTLALFGPAVLFAYYCRQTRLTGPAVVVYLLLTYFGLNFLSQTHWIILKP